MKLNSAKSSTFPDAVKNFSRHPRCMSPRRRGAYLAPRAPWDRRVHVPIESSSSSSSSVFLVVRVYPPPDKHFVYDEPSPQRRKRGGRGGVAFAQTSDTGQLRTSCFTELREGRRDSCCMRLLASPFLSRILLMGSNYVSSVARKTSVGNWWKERSDFVRRSAYCIQNSPSPPPAATIFITDMDRV